MNAPTPPPPTRCPSCGSVEATAVCRWCGCWKFSAQAVDAAFRNILAGKFWRVLPVLLLAVGCTTISPEHKDAPAGWPELKVTENVVGTADMVSKCYATLSLPMKLLGGIPMACAWVDLCAGTCSIYVTAWSPEGVLDHERLHCKGHDHLGDDTMVRVFNAFRAGACKR